MSRITFSRRDPQLWNKLRPAILNSFGLSSFICVAVEGGFDGSWFEAKVMEFSVLLAGYSLVFTACLEFWLRPHFTSVQI